MADTWMEYLQGSPSQRLQDLEYQRKQFDDARNSPGYRDLRRLIAKDTGDSDFDPRVLLANYPTADGGAIADALYPRRTSDAIEHETAALDYVGMMGQRVRDTALRSNHALQQGQPLKALELAARAPISAVYPPAAAGTPGSPDDWRKTAKESGVPGSHILAFDLLTDPEFWVTAPVRGPLALVAPAMPFAAARVARGGASKMAPAMRAIGNQMDQLRYGPGVPAQLIDAHGDVIRRLKNAPVAERLRIEYAK